MSKFIKREDAFTGLEAAIVLIAFVVVAAVFSYVVLGAGFFTTQKSQEVVHTGVAQTSSTLELSGPVVAQASSTAYIGRISFYLQLAAGGSPVDMRKVTYTISTPNKVVTFVDANAIQNPNSLTTVTRTPVGNTDDGDTLLEKLEMVMITIPVTGGDDFGTNPAVSAIKLNQKFTLEIKPDIGAALALTKTAPAGMTTNSYYDLY